VRDGRLVFGEPEPTSAECAEPLDPADFGKIMSAFAFLDDPTVELRDDQLTLTSPTGVGTFVERSPGGN
jgi:hypothetical protein